MKTVYVIACARYDSATGKEIKPCIIRDIYTNKDYATSLVQSWNTYWTKKRATQAYYDVYVCFPRALNSAKLVQE